jgi:precorrin-2 dehydrogenase/sirohydrochlorin ferrochelatase
MSYTLIFASEHRVVGLSVRAIAVKMIYESLSVLFHICLLAMPTYPIELKLTGRTVLVVGLGPVGRRKAEALSATGARVVGVDPVAGSLEPSLVEGIEVVSEPYKAEQLRGVSLAVAAGPPEVNRQVVADAREVGVWVCSTSDPEAGDFTIPAVWRAGPLMLTVSTSGASPALAAALRDQAAAALGPAAIGLTALVAELRPIVLKRLPDPLARRRIMREWAHPRWLSLWIDQGPGAVRQALWQRIEEEAR